MAGNDDDPLRIGGISRPTASASVDATAAADGATAVDATAPAEATAAIEGALAAGIDPTSAIAASLSAGAIDADGALRALVDATASAMLGPTAEPAALDALRAEVTALLAGDPTLATLLRP